MQWRHAASTIENDSNTLLRNPSLHKIVTTAHGSTTVQQLQHVIENAGEMTASTVLASLRTQEMEAV